MREGGREDLPPPRRALSFGRVAARASFKRESALEAWVWRIVINEALALPDVWVMNADGTGQRNLTPSATQPLADHAGPTWSPDGRKILFVSNRGDGNWFEVYVMNADGSGKRQLTHLKGRD